MFMFLSEVIILISLQGAKSPPTIELTFPNYKMYV